MDVVFFFKFWEYVLCRSALYIVNVEYIIDVKGSHCCWRFIFLYFNFIVRDRIKR